MDCSSELYGPNIENGNISLPAKEVAISTPDSTTEIVENAGQDESLSKRQIKHSKRRSAIEIELETSLNPKFTNIHVNPQKRCSRYGREQKSNFPVDFISSDNILISKPKSPPNNPHIETIEKINDNTSFTDHIVPLQTVNNSFKSPIDKLIDKNRKSLNLPSLPNMDPFVNLVQESNISLDMKSQNSVTQSELTSNEFSFGTLQDTQNDMSWFSQEEPSSLSVNISSYPRTYKNNRRSLSLKLKYLPNINFHNLIASINAVSPLTAQITKNGPVMHNNCQSILDSIPTENSVTPTELKTASEITNKPIAANIIQHEYTNNIKSAIIPLKHFRFLGNPSKQNAETPFSNQRNSATPIPSKRKFATPVPSKQKHATRNKRKFVPSKRNSATPTPSKRKPATPTPSKRKPATPNPSKRKPATPTPNKHKFATPVLSKQKPATPTLSKRKPATPTLSKRKPATPISSKRNPGTAICNKQNPAPLIHTEQNTAFQNSTERNYTSTITTTQINTTLPIPIPIEQNNKSLVPTKCYTVSLAHAMQNSSNPFLPQAFPPSPTSTQADHMPEAKTDNYTSSTIRSLTDFTTKTLSESVCTTVNLNQTDPTEAIVEQTDPTSTILEQADPTSINLEPTDPTSTILQKSDPASTILEQADSTSMIILEPTDATSTILEPTDPTSTILEHAATSSTILEQSDPTFSQLSVHSTTYAISMQHEWCSGDLAWARIGSHPFWPCLVCPNPDTGLCVVRKPRLKNSFNDIVHVTFFGDNFRRSLLRSTLLIPFTGVKDFHELGRTVRGQVPKVDSKYAAAFIVHTNKLNKWNIAVLEAEAAYKTGNKDRLELILTNNIHVSPNLSKIKGKNSTDFNRDSLTSKSTYKSKCKDPERTQSNKKKSEKAIGSRSLQILPKSIKRHIDKSLKVFPIKKIKLSEKKSDGQIKNNNIMLIRKDNEKDTNTNDDLLQLSPKCIIKNKTSTDKEVTVSAERPKSDNKVNGNLCVARKTRSQLLQRPVCDLLDVTDNQSTCMGSHSTPKPNNLGTIHDIDIYNFVDAESSFETDSMKQKRFTKRRNSLPTTKISKSSIDNILLDTSVELRPNLSPDLNSSDEGMEKFVKKSYIKKHSIKLKTLNKVNGAALKVNGIASDLGNKLDDLKPKSEISDVSDGSEVELRVQNIRADFYVKKSKNYLFRGLSRERVCEICTKPSRLLKCKGPCCGYFHYECVNVTSGCTINNTLENVQNISGASEQTCRVMNILDFQSEADARMKEIMSNVDEHSETDTTITTTTDDEITEEQGSCVIVEVKSRRSKYSKKLLNLEHFLVKDDSQVSESWLNEHDIINFKCNNCSIQRKPRCFVCNQDAFSIGCVTTDIRQRCSIYRCGKYYHLECLKVWPQTKFNSSAPRNHKKSNIIHEMLLCPYHVCHTCVSDDPRGCKTRFMSDKLSKCIKCPTAYHSSAYCIPAGSQLLTTSQLICPKHCETGKKTLAHLNASWCFICAVGGSLICCETCPTAFHAECLKIPLPEGGYICEECETGRFPLYDEVVWCKLGTYRWWPAKVLPPPEVPPNINAIKHNSGEFCVRFFGSWDYYWVNRGRVFLYQEGDSGKTSRKKNTVDGLFVQAVQEAAIAYELIKGLKDTRAAQVENSLKPPHYIKIKSNKPVGNVRIIECDISSMTPCDCDPTQPDPCGPQSDCLNRLLMTECNPSVCRAGTLCCNQAFEKRLYPPLEPCRTGGRGWGLKLLADVHKGDFIVEYVGEIIDSHEYRRRIERKHEQRDENYYFLTIDKERMLDAGPKGNVARFMNHSCEPNCETQKWTVNGDTRVGLFAMQDIFAGSELTFNYNLECAGAEKKTCMCGAPRCSGFIGAKVNKDESPKKSYIKNIKSPRKKNKKFETVKTLLPNVDSGACQSPDTNHIIQMEVNNMCKNNVINSNTANKLNHTKKHGRFRKKKILNKMKKLGRPRKTE